MAKPFLAFLSLSFFLSFKLIAADCSGMQEGEIIRLDAPGKSLANFKIQDQDGLGTCASNASSLLLHSSVPGNPGLSYIQLASIFKRSSLNDKRLELTNSNSQVFDLYAKRSQKGSGVVNPNSSAEDKWELGIDGANVCGVIAAAKEYQKSSPTEGICRSETVNIEKKAGSEDPRGLQKKSILAISKYMNEFQKSFGEAAVVKSNAPADGKKTGFFDLLKPNKYSESEVKKNEEARLKYIAFKTAFETQLNNKDLIHEKDCKQVNADLFEPVMKKITDRFLAHTYCFDGAHDSYIMCQLINKMMTVTKHSDGGFQANIKNNFLNSILLTFKDSNDSVSASDIKTKVHNSIQKIHNNPLGSYLESELAIAMDEMDEILAKTAAEIKEIKTQGFSKICSERKLMNYLVSDDFKKDVKKDQVLCNSIGIIENVRDVVNSTAFTGLVDAAKIKDFLLKNANLNFDEAMLNLYAYDCSAADKVKIPESLTCSIVSVTRDTKDAINKKIVGQLKNNRALGASICAAILDKPKREFAVNECGNHAVGITGVQCTGGKLKYLIQNSWGKNSKVKNPAIVNDPSENGSYWLDEQTLFDGFNAIQSLEL